jgi:hypothetical protein
VVAEQPAATVAPTVPAPVETAEPRAASQPVAPAAPVKPLPPVAAPRAPAPKVAGSNAPPRQPAPAASPAAVKPVPTPAVAPPVTKAAAPPLDLTSLETRLRETAAIGVFTKLSLKNQVDDLLAKFRAYHKRQTTTPLAELRQSYNLLLLKVLALLQDSDPSLARDVVASREAIWGILSDPKKFTESNLMAGVTP